MRGRIKAALCLMLAVGMALSGGCANARELNELIIVMGIGMDTDIEAEGNIKLIAQIVQPEKLSSGSDNSSGGSSEKAFVNISSSAPGTFEAVRNYTHMVTGKLYISHNQIIVIGRQLAERGISEVLDFFVRAKETRPTVSFIIADTTAEEILGVQPEMNMMPAIYLDKLVEAQDANSETFGADMIDYISAMQSETLSLVIPIVHLEMNGENVVHVIDSMAVFKGDQMVGELDATQTRGLLWVKGRVSSGVINVDIDDGLASLEILNATSKVEPMVSDDGKVTMRISISTDLRLTEQTCTENLATDENLLRLQELAKKAIKQKIEQVFEQAKTLHADVFGFGELIHKHHNDIWTNMEPNWDEIFQTITLDIEIEPTIKAVGSIEEPAWDRGGLEP